MSLRRGRLAAAALASVLAACGAASPGTFELPAEEAAQYETAYLAAVVAEPDDATENGGEHVVVRNDWDHRTDMGGWYIETDDGARLPLGIGRQIDPDAQLRVYTRCGEDTDDAVYACLDREVLGAEGGVVTLRDSAGGEVARFAFGSAVGEG